MIRGLWAAIGLIALALGVIGMFLPFLPTVPFLLAAGFFFGKSSARLHRWLLTRPGGLDSASTTEILLNVDAEAQHKHVVRAMDELRKEGLTRFVISTQPVRPHA